MTNDDQSEHETEGRSLSRERNIRSQKSGSRTGKALLFSMLLIVGGIAWYGVKIYLPEKAQQAYELETEKLISDANSELARLNEWSSEASLEAFAAKTQAVASREGVEASWLESVTLQLQPMLTASRERGELFEHLMGRISELNRQSGRGEISALDKKILDAKGKFSVQQFGEIEKAWKRRRAVIGADVETASGAMTLHTIPSKADVYLDGKRIAATPFKAKGLMTGEHQLVLKKAGYRDLSMAIVLESGRDLELGPLELIAIAGGLRIEVSGGRKKDVVEIEIEEFSEEAASGAFQVVQGFKLLKGREHTLDALKAGKYSIVILSNEKVIHRDSFTVDEGEVTEFRFEL